MNKALKYLKYAYIGAVGTMGTAAFGLVTAAAVCNLTLPEGYGSRSAEEVLSDMGYDPAIAEAFEQHRQIRVYDDSLDGFWALLGDGNFDLIPHMLKNEPVATMEGNECRVILYDDAFTVRDKLSSRLGIDAEKLEVPDRITDAFRYLTAIHEFRHCAQPRISVPKEPHYIAMSDLLSEIDSDIAALNYSRLSEDPNMREALVTFGHIRSFDNIVLIAQNFNENKPFKHLDHVTALGIYGGGYTAEQIVVAHAELMPQIVSRMDDEADIEDFLQIYDIAQELMSEPELDAIQREILQKYITSVDFIAPAALAEHLGIAGDDVPAAATLEF